MKFAGTFIIALSADSQAHATEQLESLAKVVRLVPQVDSVVLVEGPEEMTEGMAEEIEIIEQGKLDL